MAFVEKNICVILRTKLNASIRMMDNFLSFGICARAIFKAWMRPSVSREGYSLKLTIFLEYKFVIKERYANPSLTLM
ncbi:hypothetical protein ACLK31_12665 [Leptospira borgpetersenii]|uniref:hypothetical protein n=1 Tax=Leptospira borgpetersenii TaxID=174 RepID=UPI0011876D74|nr:hypothetical protein [Leptospira borgpetersenii]QHH50949.1 hypothetical protein GS516_13170 [Leptospira borgpetersenii]